MNERSAAGSSAPAPLGPSPAGRAPATLLAAAGGGALAVVLAASAAPPGAGRGALAAVAAALVVALAAPAAAAARAPADARGPAASPIPLRAAGAGGGGVAACLALALAQGLAPAQVAWTAVYLVLWALATGLLARLGGALAATAAALALVAAPWVLGPLGALVRPGLALEALLCAPGPALASLAGVDLLRGPVLYRTLPIAQSVPYAYPAPDSLVLTALAVVAALGLLALARPGLRRAARAFGRGTPRGPTPGLSAPAVAALLLLGLPSAAEAQLIPAPSPGGGDPYPVGDLQTRVALGYYVPDLRGSVRLDGRGGERGNYLSFDRTLDLDPAFVVPTFEVSLSWANAGRVTIGYVESRWRGEAGSSVFPLQIEEQSLPLGNATVNEYNFRTISLQGELFIPVADFLTLRLLGTQRYIKHEVSVLSAQTPFFARNSLETVLPGVGAGVDVFIWNVISLYADIQWLDFKTSALGAKDDRWEYRYREWKVGVRLELVQHAHIQLEWFSLETLIVDGRRERYEQDLNGARILVAVLF